MPSDYVRSQPDFFAVGPASAPAAIDMGSGIWCSPGMSSTYLVTTADAKIVVNTGMWFEARTHKRNFDAVTTAPTRYIVLTQSHTDHIGGVDTFREADTQLVAQANITTCQADDARIHGLRIRRSLPFFADVIGQPGYAWAARRDELTSVAGLIDWSIMGSNDYYMALALIGQVEPATTGMPASNYAAMRLQWQHRCEQHVHRDIGYVGTTLLHYWHGNRKHRGYETRWRILADHQFDPAIDLRKDTVGLLNLTDANPGLRDEIRSYFRSRREDDSDT